MALVCSVRSATRVQWNAIGSEPNIEDGRGLSVQNKIIPVEPAHTRLHINVDYAMPLLRRRLRLAVLLVLLIICCVVVGVTPVVTASAAASAAATPSVKPTCC